MTPFGGCMWSTVRGPRRRTRWPRPRPDSPARRAERRRPCRLLLCDPAAVSVSPQKSWMCSNVLLVLFQFVDHRVVKFVSVSAERLVAFQDDHRRTVGIELVEHLADVFERLIRRRLGRAEADVVHLPTSSSCGTRIFGTAASATQNSRIGTESRRMVCGNEGRRLLWLLIRTCPGRRCRRSIALTVLSSLTTPLTVMRQPRESPLPCATTLPKTAARCRDRVGPRQGRVQSTRCGASIDVQVVDGRHRPGVPKTS